VNAIGIDLGTSSVKAVVLDDRGARRRTIFPKGQGVKNPPVLN
jgi:sugar (pentulose or hexulose) kinase